MDTNEIFSRIVAIYDEGGVLPVCAWCGRVRIDGAWLVPPPAALDAIDARQTLSHSVCDVCGARGAPVGAEAG